jgi:hypothetical protein
LPKNKIAKIEQVMPVSPASFAHVPDTDKVKRVTATRASNKHLNEAALINYQLRLAQVMLNHVVVVPFVKSVERDGNTLYFCGVCKLQINQDGDQWKHQ